MKNTAIKSWIFILFFLNTFLLLAQQNDWENPAGFQQNRLIVRSTFVNYQDKTSAIKDVATHSPYYMLLSGKWKFNWVPKPNERPLNFFKSDFDSSNFMGCYSIGKIPLQKQKLFF